MTYELKPEYIECCKGILENVREDENLHFKRSLPICIMDAVFSIGAKYISAVNVWKRYLAYYDLNLKTFAEVSENETDDAEHTVSDFLKNADQFSDAEAFVDKVLKNRQRTSPRNGILKAQAVLDIANIMKVNNIDTINDFRNFEDKERLNEQILSVCGQRSGIMLRYLYMLAGDTDTCKPDRWLYRFLSEFYPDIQMEDIQTVMTDTVMELKKYRPDVTVRMLDGAVWEYQRRDPAKKHNNGC